MKMYLFVGLLLTCGLAYGLKPDVYAGAIFREIKKTPTDLKYQELFKAVCTGLDSDAKNLVLGKVDPNLLKEKFGANDKLPQVSTGMKTEDLPKSFAPDAKATVTKRLQDLFGDEPGNFGKQVLNKVKTEGADISQVETAIKGLKTTEK